MEHMKRGDELPSGVLEMVKVYVATKRQLVGRRQDGRPSRKQGRHRPHRAGRGHAVPRRRHAGGHHAQPAGRAVAYERRPDPRDAPRLGDDGARPAGGHAGVRRRDRRRDSQGASKKRTRPSSERRKERKTKHTALATARAGCARCRTAERSSFTTAAPASRSSRGRRSATST